MGEYETPDDETYKVQVTVNPKEKTIRIEDNGLGMTEDEVDEYINQIAFSGAQDFLNKYKDKANENRSSVTRTGFYSACHGSRQSTTIPYPIQAGCKAGSTGSLRAVTEFDMKEGTKGRTRNRDHPVPE